MLSLSSCPNQFCGLCRLPPNWFCRYSRKGVLNTD